MGYSRKYPHPSPPLWTILNWVLKNFRISKNDSGSFCRIPNLTGSKSWGIPEFCNTSNGFRGIPVKIHKIWRKFMDFQSCSLNIFYRISNVVHGVCVGIFSGIAEYLSQLEKKYRLTRSIQSNLPIARKKFENVLCLKFFCH